MSETGVRQQRYKPSLSGLMSLCDVNYMLLLRIIANNERVGEKSCFFISDFLSYTVLINEVTRYTSLVTISQDMPTLEKMLAASSSTTHLLNSNIKSALRPKMVIRLYHDARMAEVVSNQDIRQVKPRYDYPNDHMHQPDEKHQINTFLKEWLQLCHSLGQVDVPLSTP